MFNINTFKSNIDGNGYVPTNRFYVEFGSPPLMKKAALNILGNPVKVSSVQQLLRFRAESIRAPGVVISTSNNQRYGFGPMQQMPTNVNFTNISASFLADSRGLVWGYFYQWFNTIFGFDEILSSGYSSTVPADYNSFRVNYKTDYVADINLYVYDHYGKLTTSLTLRDAFPISMNDVSLSWDTNNQLKRITVSFSYRSWNMNSTESNADMLAATQVVPKTLHVPEYVEPVVAPPTKRRRRATPRVIPEN